MKFYNFELIFLQKKESLKKIRFFLQDFINLFFPNSCTVCGRTLIKGENVLCTFCINDLPRTRFHKQPDNPVIQLFYANPRILYGTAYFIYKKGSRFQKLIHQLKYKGCPEIGIELGKHFGNDILGSVFHSADVLVPVPLHPERFKKRGYNQSEKICQGMSVSMSIPVDFKSVIRTVNTQTQTRKNKEERHKNVESIFSIQNPEMLKNKHVLVVDDIITTGSTMLSFAEEILKIEGTKVSVAALGVAID